VVSSERSAGHGSEITIKTREATGIGHTGATGDVEKANQKWRGEIESDWRVWRREKEMAKYIG
jgi:hypothetical protein